MEYIKFKRKDLGYVDAKGNHLDSIAGMQNRPGIDEFRHLGYDYPDFMLSDKKARWYSEGEDVVVELDITKQDADAVVGANSAKQATRPDKEDKLLKKMLK